MVLLTFADNSTCNIPLEELQKIPFFNKIPTLTEDSHEVNLSFNENFTYSNIIRCIAFSESINDSCENLIDFVGIDVNYYHKNIVKEVLKIDLKSVKNINFNALTLRCKLDHTYLIDNYAQIFKLPIDVIKQCITKENINIQNIRNDTTLILASWNGHTEIVKLLIKAGANINLQGYKNTTALIGASQSGYTEIVKLLIKAGANINLQGYKNTTALIGASQSGYTEIVKLLIEAGADVNIQNENNRTALIVASEKDYTEIIKLLEEALLN